MIVLLIFYTHNKLGSVTSISFISRKLSRNFLSKQTATILYLQFNKLSYNN